MSYNNVTEALESLNKLPRDTSAYAIEELKVIEYMLQVRVPWDGVNDAGMILNFPMYNFAVNQDKGILYITNEEGADMEIPRNWEVGYCSCAGPATVPNHLTFYERDEE